MSFAPGPVNRLRPGSLHSCTRTSGLRDYQFGGVRVRGFVALGRRRIDWGLPATTRPESPEVLRTPESRGHDRDLSRGLAAGTRAVARGGRVGSGRRVDERSRDDGAGCDVAW